MDLKEKIRTFPDAPGVYLMKDAGGKVIYVGKAKSLRKRVMSYFTGSPGDDRPALPALLREVRDVEYVPAESDVDALLMEARLIKDIQPRFNRELRDDKTFPYVEVTLGDDFPRVDITRRADNRRSRYFGPFTDVKGMRRAVQLMQRVFKFRTCTLEISADDPKRRFNRPCLLHAIDRCTAPCADRIGKRDYREQIGLLMRFMEGKRARVLRTLKKRMEACAERLQFEEAARLRNELRALEALSRTGDIVTFPEAFAAPVADFQQGLLDLQKRLALEATPRRVDGVDVAVLQGREAVGSIVTFVDGKPFKSGYRRFRIRNAPTQDDYAMIAEVIQRRYRRLLAEEEPLPDIQLVDGGLGHLNAVRDCFARLGIAPPVLLALAKKEETVYAAVGDAPPRQIPGLRRGSLGLRVLQHVRDEAHRFAQHYHHLLRRKATRPAEPKRPRSPRPPKAR